MTDQDIANLLIEPRIPVALDPAPNDYAYLIHRKDRAAPLQVMIDRVWPGHEVFGPTLVTLLWNGVEPVDSLELEAGFDPEIEFPLELKVPQGKLLTPGEFEIRYRVDNGNPSVSHPVIIRVDSEAPNHGGLGSRLDFADTPEVITEAYLAANGQKLSATTRWPDVEYGDVLYWYWDQFSTDSASQAEPRIEDADGWVEVDDPQPVVRVEIPGDVIRRKNNGLRYCHYVLVDRSGNPGPGSRSVEFEVLLDALPDLPHPDIPLSLPDGLVDLGDARVGVQVEIPFFANVRHDDGFEAFWNGHSLGRQTIDAETRWPLRFDVPWAVLSLGALEQVINVGVRYNWERQGINPVPSPIRVVSVDLRVAGPVNPENPGPINPLLPRPVVLGQTEEDVLTDADFGLDARVRIRLHAELLEGQWLGVYWGAHSDAFVHQLDSDDIEQGEVQIDVPWEVVFAQGNNTALPVYYYTFNDRNYQHSPSTAVRVEIIRVVDLPAARFPDADLHKWINCYTVPPPYEGITIRIPAASGLQAGDVVEVYWQGCANNNGSNPITGTDIVLRKEQPLTAVEAQDGFDLHLSQFSPYIEEPAKVIGSGLVYYRATRLGGGRHYSQYDFVRVSVVWPGGGYCLG